MPAPQHGAVMRARAHHDQALNHIEAVKASESSLRAILSEAGPSAASRNRVTALNAQLGQALKLAQVEAGLAQAAQLDRIATLLEQLVGPPSAIDRGRQITADVRAYTRAGGRP